MSEEFCAREGCGAPKAYHQLSSTIAELLRANDRRYELGDWPDGFRHNDVHVYSGCGNDITCRGSDCHCAAYLAPQPPLPARKPYVVEMTDEQRDSYRKASTGIAAWLNQHFVPLDEYLAAHPQPEPKRCICGGREDEHRDGMACLHVVKFMNGGGTIVRMSCQCERFRAAQS